MKINIKGEGMIKFGEQENQKFKVNGTHLIYRGHEHLIPKEQINKNGEIEITEEDLMACLYGCFDPQNRLEDISKEELDDLLALTCASLQKCEM